MSSAGRDATTTQQMLLPMTPESGLHRVACLVVIQGERLGARVEIKDRPVIMGRSPDADFQIPQRSVSRHHCRIWRSRDGYHLKDLDSTNHTYVNEQPVIEVALKDGDHITVGQTILKFISQTSPEAKYHEELHQLATNDTLTGLYNRRFFMEALEKEIQSPNRQDQNFCVMFLDLDLFKPINDRLGHLCGDQVLRSVSDILRARLRQGDIAARVGGEEFAVLVPDTALVPALGVAEDLRDSIAQARIAVGSEVLSVTISIGVSEWSARMTSPADILRSADQQLYRAKSSGRNRVCSENDA